jgi:OmpA-OmpF porin, OOP family
MKNILLLVGSSLALLAAPLSAQGQFHDFSAQAGPYFRADVGPTFMEDGQLKDFGNFAVNSKVSYDVGFGMDLAGGFAVNRWFAAELEFGWQGNEIDSVKGFSTGDTFFYQVPFLANAVFQYPILRNRLVPYVGGGFGGAVTIFDADGFSDGNVTLFGSDDDFVFAYQGFAGVRFNLNDQMFVGLGYKYLFTDDSSFRYESGSGSGPDLHLKFRGVNSHMVTFSFTMRF